MDIKTLAPKRYGIGTNYRQGYYEPVNRDKYVGGYPIIYRSSWEYRMCRLLDLSGNVTKWGSECMKVRYFSSIDQKYHEYFPDFYFVWEKDGVSKRYVVEVKPKKYLTAPERPKRLTEKSLANYRYESATYIRNMEKAKACKLYCDSNGIEYKFVTEDSKIPDL